MEAFLNLPIIRFFHHIPYKVKTALIILLILLALILSTVFMLLNQNRLIKLFEGQLKVTVIEDTLRDTAEEIINHHILLLRYNNGEKGLKGEILQLQTALTSSISNLQSTLFSLEKDQGIEEPGLAPSWQTISQNSFTVPVEKLDPYYQDLLENLQLLMMQTHDGTSLIEENPLPIRQWIDVTLSDMPRVLVLQDALLSGVEDSTLLSTRLEETSKKNIYAMQRGLKLIKQRNEDPALLESIQTSLNKYITTMNDFISNIKSKNENKQEILLKAETAFNDQFNIWQQLADSNENYLKRKIKSVQFERALLLFLILLFLTLSLLLLAITLSEILVPLNSIKDAIERFSKGDMSSRSKTYFNDEIGKNSKTLNHLGEMFEHIVNQMHRIGVQLTTSTTEIAAAAKQQEITVVEQEATTKEIAVTAGEISATAKEFARTMNSISKTAEETSNLANNGKEGLNLMETIMRQMVDASGNIASRLGILNEKAGAITSVVSTIAKVADQTNLLSLNASIEAEKAGELGRAFAVIAREIRRLADQTANATVDIEKMVNEMVSAVSASVMGVDKFTEEIRSGVKQVTKIGEVLSQIIEQVQGLTASFENVNQGMRNQTMGAEQINEAISQLSDVAQQTSVSIRQFQNAIEQLNMAARDMQSSAAKIRHI